MGTAGWGGLGVTPPRVHPAAAAGEPGARRRGAAWSMGAAGRSWGGSPFPRCDVACGFGIPRGSPQPRCQPSRILSLSDGFDIYLWICLALILS